MLTGYRFRLYPTKEQERTLLRWIGCQRLIYNAKVSEDHYFRTFQRKALCMAGQDVPVDQKYSHFKTDRTPFLREVPSQVLRNGAVLFRQSYQRFFRGLAGRPRHKRRSGEQSVWLTSELFSFEPDTDPAMDEVLRYRLWVGTVRFPVGEITCKAHRRHGVPASIHISVHGGRWFVSFSVEDPALAIPVTAERVAEKLRQMSFEELAVRTCGADRGVAKPLATSDGQVYDLRPVQKDRIKAARTKKKRWQRRAARRKKGSKNRAKAHQRVARYDRYEANVRENYAHQTSHALVTDNEFMLYAFEDLRVQNMIRRPKARCDEHGQWIKNGARAKAGLNRAILCSAWGQVYRYTEYKALRAGKLVVKVPFAYSSQECAECGHIHPDNRRTQSEFVCLSCEHTDNADHNAARVLARRGVALLLSGAPLTKPKKTTRIYRNNVGPERSELTPGETEIRRGAGSTRSAHRSLSQELPVETPETHTTARSA